MVQSLGHGGCERDAAKLAIGLDRRRFAPHVGVLREGGFRFAEVRDAGIPIVTLPVTSFMNASVFKAARKLGEYVRQHGIRLVHAFDVPTDIFSAPAARYYRVPLLVTAQLSYRSLVTPRERALLRVSDRLSDTVVVNSQAVGDSLQRAYGLPAKKIFLCYNGVNSSEFYPATVDRPDFLKNASVVVGSVCVMRPEKRMDWVIRAFAQVSHHDTGARLLLVGSGPEVPRLQELSRSLGLSETCFFVPGQANVADWLRMIDIYINASVSESFPNALLEAMACGCCAVGSRVGGIPELISDRHTGLIFDSEDLASLVEVLQLAVTDTQLRDSLRHNAFTTAHSRFSIQNTIDRMQSLYETLLDKEESRQR